MRTEPERNTGSRVRAALLAAWIVVVATGCGARGSGDGELDLSVDPSTLIVPAGGEAAATVEIRAADADAGPIRLTSSGAPEGVHVAFDPDEAPGNEADVLVSADTDAPEGTHVLSLRGTRSGTTASVGLTLEIVPPVPPSTVDIDPDLAANAPSMPPHEDGLPRPVAALRDEDGVPTYFVANELIVVTDDEAALDALLARHAGERLATVDRSALEAEALAPMHLIRVAPDPADTDAFLDDLHTIDPGVRSDLTVDGAAGVDLLAAASRETVAGGTVVPNWIGTGASFTDGSSLEATPTEFDHERYDSANVFDWDHMGAGGLGIGVAQAWWALEAAGSLDERVRIGVLDGGFLPSADMPSVWHATSIVHGDDPIGSPNPAGCGDGNDCPWHGTASVWAAAAVPDNGFGTAGPAGPIAELVTVQTAPDMFSATVALLTAVGHGVDIVSMSFSSRIPAAFFWTVVPFDATTAAVRVGGTLLFASAGNSGEDVDAEHCPLLVCWERAWHTPCENAGVICVGGTGQRTPVKAASSNYGADDVDIFAPYWVFAPTDRANPGGSPMGLLGGTSVSSPFAAGVAALIWAAGPHLSASQVEMILLSTAHVTTDPLAPIYVNAIGGVQTVLGGTGPTVTITSPLDETYANALTVLSATVHDLEDGLDCCIPSWSSDLDGPLGTGHDHLVGLSPGTHELTASATDSDGNVGSDTRTVTAISLPPNVTIVHPDATSYLVTGKPTVFVADVYDVNHPGGFDCGNVTWVSDHPADPAATGCTPTVTFDVSGTRTWTATATDGPGVSGDDSVTVSVSEGPALWASIVAPAPDVSVFHYDEVSLFAEASPEFELPATFTWSVSTDGETYDEVASGNVTTLRDSDDPWVPGRTWVPGIALEGDSVHVRFTIDAANGSVAEDLPLPVHVLAVPH